MHAIGKINSITFMLKSEDSTFVSVYCLAYNKKTTIIKTIEGILMQRTNFNFEIIIYDDASTDGTTDIIIEYANQFPEIIKPIIQTSNKFSQEGFILEYNYIFPIVKGKYIAVCDGDDIWIDPLKLQKQVDFLETNSEYGLVHTKAAKYNFNLGKFGNVLGYECSNFEQLIEECTIVHSTVCFRHDLLKKFISEIQPQHRFNWSLCNDFPKFLWFSRNSKIKLLDEVTTIYNVFEVSQSRQTNLGKRLNYHENINDIVDYFLEQNGNNNFTWKIKAIYISEMISEFLLCKKWEGVSRGIKIFYKAKDWLNLIWLLSTIPFYFSPFFIKSSYFLQRKLIGYKYKNI